MIKLETQSWEPKNQSLNIKKHKLKMGKMINKRVNFIAFVSN